MIKWEESIIYNCICVLEFLGGEIYNILWFLQAIKLKWQNSVSQCLLVCSLITNLHFISCSNIQFKISFYPFTFHNKIIENNICLPIAMWQSVKDTKVRNKALNSIQCPISRSVISYLRLTHQLFKPNNHLFSGTSNQQILTGEGVPSTKILQNWTYIDELQKKTLLPVHWHSDKYIV